MNIGIEWFSKPIRLFNGVEISNSEVLPVGGQVLKQWSVTAHKDLGPHVFEKTLTVQQLGTPPVAICRALEARVLRDVEQQILFHRELAEEGAV